MQNLAAFILAGGESSRMGAHKALLELGGRTLLELALGKARALAVDVRIVGPRERLAAYGAVVVEDAYSGRGPLGGIHAALASSATDLNLILAVDMPFLEVAFLERLAERARRSGALVTVPRAAGGLQPLCAVYRREFVPLAQAALQRGENKIDALFAPSTTQIITLGEDDFAFSADMFDNLNTRQELEQARRRATS